MNTDNIEIWKDVIDYEGLYEVSNLGNVRNNYRTLTQTKSKDGYRIVNLVKNGKRKNHFVHRLVAKAFIENPENKPSVNHLNEIKSDNRAINLSWVTPSENINYGTCILRGRITRTLRYLMTNGTEFRFVKKRAAIESSIWKFWNCFEKPNF